MKQKFIFLTILFAFLTISNIYAQDKKISIQGILKDSNGAAASDGSYSLQFKLYDELQGGTSLWNETAQVDVVGGVYSHLLGSVTTLPDNIFGQSLFLGVTVGGSELVPRTELTYAPYTISATSIASNNGSAGFDANGNVEIITPNDNFEVDATGNTIIGGTLNVAGTITGDLTGDVTGNITGTTTIGGDITCEGNFISIGDVDSGIRSINNDHLSIRVGGIDAIHVDGAGHPARIGLFTSNPDFPFSVGAYARRDLSQSGVQGTYFEWSTGVNSSFGSGGIAYANNVNAPTDRAVAYFDGDVLASEAFASLSSLSFSDRRIKKDIQLSDAKADLDQLNQIAIKNYRHIDNKIKGVVKKVIAQELEEVYPNAVSTTRNIIPNVYEYTKNVAFENEMLTITTSKKHEFQKGDKVDVYTPQQNYNSTEVTSVINDHTFCIEAEISADQVFVYGKWVDDYRIVDYDAIAMLNVSATQELYRQVVVLQKENEALKTDMGTRLAKIEAMMQTPNASTDDNTRASER